MTLDPVRSDPRRGGAVERYHTWPTIQRQTVDAHSWNVVRILVTIWPEAPAPAIINAIFHDVGEVATGDPPYPIKADNPVLKEEMDRLEGEAVSRMGIPQAMMSPDDALHWRVRIKICDIIEMWEFGLDEMALGSRYARPIVDRMMSLRKELVAKFRLPDEDIAAIQKYEARRWSHQP